MLDAGRWPMIAQKWFLQYRYHYQLQSKPIAPSTAMTTLVASIGYNP